jgi:Putative zinc-finger
MTQGNHPPVERVSAYLAADLSERDATAVRRHLGDCPDCGRVVDELRRQSEALSTLERPEPPLTMWAAIEGACDGRSDGRFGLPWGGAAAALWSWRSMVLGAALGGVVVSGAFALWRPGGQAGRSGADTSGGVAGVAALVGSPEPIDPLLAEAEAEFGRAALSYEAAAGRLRAILDHEQLGWNAAQRARVAERLARLDEAVAESRTVARRDPGDGARAEMLFAAYQKQIDFLAEVVHRGGSSLDLPVGGAIP